MLSLKLDKPQSAAEKIIESKIANRPINSRVDINGDVYWDNKPFSITIEEMNIILLELLTKDHLIQMLLEEKREHGY